MKKRQLPLPPAPAWWTAAIGAKTRPPGWGSPSMTMININTKYQHGENRERESNRHPVMPNPYMTVMFLSSSLRSEGINGPHHTNIHSVSVPYIYDVPQMTGHSAGHRANTIKLQSIWEAAGGHIRLVIEDSLVYNELLKATPWPSTPHCRHREAVKSKTLVYLIICLRDS